MVIKLAEQFRGASGAAVGIAVTALISRLVLGPWGDLPWLLAPLGASAVLVFVLPSSPLGQPWAVIGSQVVSTLVGLLCAAWIPDPGLAAGLAVGLSIAAMFGMRCLHPPGGGMALVAVLSTSLKPELLLLVVTLNTVLLVAVACVYHPATGHRYPHRSFAQAAAAPSPAQPSETGTSQGPRFSAADLDEALKHYREVLDVSRDDLETLLHEAEAAAYRRTLGSLRVRETMSRDPVVVSPTTWMSQAWDTMRLRGVKALPVVDEAGALVGILTRSDCLRATPLHGRFEDETPQASQSPSMTVQWWMSRQVTAAREGQSLIELLSVFSQAGHHHLPVVNAAGRLVGILTESDVVRALAAAVRTP